jgi:protein CMS1
VSFEFCARACVVADTLLVDALSVSALSHIILDVSYQDSKKRSLLDMTETRDDVFKVFFSAPRLMEVIQKGKVQVVLF